MNILTLQGHVRENIGTSSSRKLRREGKLPAIVYGNDKEAMPIYIDHNKLIVAETLGQLFNNVLNIDIDGRKERVIIKDLQRHPFKPLFIHADFLRVNSKEEITVTVPIEVVGQEHLTKQGAIINIVIHELDILCLPEDIPTTINVDLTDNKVGDVITLGDIKLSDGLEMRLLASNEEAINWPAINIDYPKVNNTVDSDAEEDAESEPSAE